MRARDERSEGALGPTRAVERAPWPGYGQYASCALALVLILGVGGGPGRAQVIRSYEHMDRSAGEESYATAVFLFEGATGNAEYLDTDVSGAVGYRGESHWVRLYPAYQVRRSNGRRVVDTRSIHLRHSLVLSHRSRTFAFVQLQSERAIDLDRRFLVGGGLRYQLVSLGQGGVDLGVGLMLEDERRKSSPGRSDLRGAHFLSTYGDAGAVKLSGTVYVQPVLTEWGDERILLNASAIIPLIAHVSLDVSSSWRREARSPVGIETNDAQVRIGFRVDLN